MFKIIIFILIFFLSLDQKKLKVLTRTSVFFLNHSKMRRSKRASTMKKEEPVVKKEKGLESEQVGLCSSDSGSLVFLILFPLDSRSKQGSTMKKEEPVVKKEKDLESIESEQDEPSGSDSGLSAA
jgi:hypothetical protein